MALEEAKAKWTVVLLKYNFTTWERTGVRPWAQKIKMEGTEKFNYPK